MITQIRLENYKCFKEEKKIDLSKLTILTGANSSGKTSIITSLVSALQSEDFPYSWSLNGDYINLGDFAEISNNKDGKNIIKIGFTINKGNSSLQSVREIDTYWEIDKISKQPILNRLQSKNKGEEVDLRYLKKGNKYVLKIILGKKDESDDKEFTKIYSLVNRYYHTEQTDYKADLKHLNVKVVSEKKTEITIEAKELQSLSAWLIINREKFNFNIVFRQLINVFTSYGKDFNYISSFRSYPQRTFLETKLSAGKISKFGDGYLDQILSWQTKKTSNYFRLLAELKQMKLLKGLHVYRIKGGRYDVRVKTKLSEKYSSLSDVGFGISQFLPILVGDLQLGKGSTLAVLQPEIHLHPSMQSNFGDFIIKQIKNHGKNYIIETHSEYFLNKIRLGIVKGEIKKEDVTVYFLENNSHDCILHRISFDQKGKIINAPKTFFETYMLDLKQITLEAFK